MFLGEHVLYGSSRLGVSSYDNYKVGYSGNALAYPRTAGTYLCYLDPDDAGQAAAHQPLTGTVGIVGGNIETIKPFGVVRIPSLLKPITGTNLPWVDAGVKPTKEPTILTPGHKRYEFGNHLGNVLVTVSDMPIGVDDGDDGSVDYYMPNVLSTSDYEPFGAKLSERTEYEQNKNYRFGFNGKEKVDEAYGEGNAYDFGARIYDPRLGRWLAIDPQETMYTGWSPYSFSLNSPLQYNDPNGEWVERKVTKYDAEGKPITGLRKFFNIGVKSIEVSLIVHNVKLYNGSGISASPELLQKVAENIRARIQEVWTTKYLRTRKGVTVSVKTYVPEPIKVIYSLDNVKTRGGRGSDNLIYIAPKNVMTGDGESPFGANLMILSAVTAGLTDEGNADYLTVGHEFGHALNLDHSRDPNSIMVDGGSWQGNTTKLSVQGEDAMQAVRSAINGDYSETLKLFDAIVKKFLQKVEAGKKLELPPQQYEPDPPSTPPTEEKH